MTVKDEIKQAINTIVKKEIQKLNISRDVTSVVMDVKGDKYKVSIDGTDYWLKDGIGLGLTIGTQVWVRIVGSEKYIASRK